MALPESGPLSLGDIAEEKGVSLQNVSLNTQSTTGINQNSPSKPNGEAPYAISEFYGYNQSALAVFNADENQYPDNIEACAAGTVNIEWYHDGTGSYPTNGDTVYTDSEGTTNPVDGFYFMENNDWISIESGVVVDTGGC